MAGRQAGSMAALAMAGRTDGRTEAAFVEHCRSNVLAIAMVLAAAAAAATEN